MVNMSRSSSRSNFQSSQPLTFAIIDDVIHNQAELAAFNTRVMLTSTFASWRFWLAKATFIIQRRQFLPWLRRIFRKALTDQSVASRKLTEALSSEFPPELRRHPQFPQPLYSRNVRSPPPKKSRGGAVVSTPDLVT
jgi:hypothetical protein